MLWRTEIFFGYTMHHLTLLFLVVTLSPPTLPQEVDECGPCLPDQCPPIDRCEAGMVKDRCDCCLVCGQLEGQLCDPQHTLPPTRYGRCGDDLECRRRPDSATQEGRELPEEPEFLCFCKYQETLCGSDGKTYRNLCKLMEQAYQRKENTTETEVMAELKVEHRGPCKSAPWLETAPESVEGRVGDGVVLTCEVMGFPIPSVEWTYSGYDGDKIMLPSDLDHIAVQARGGPEQYEVTSWLQIQGLTPTDEGEYVCTGRNELGTVKAAARVTVTDKDKYMDIKEFPHHSANSNDI